jgi:hypothetical protein
MALTLRFFSAVANTSIQFTDNIKMLDAVTSTTTSEMVDVSKRQQIIIQFIAAGGTSVFTINVSNDGTNWITGIAFLDSAATAVGTYVTSKSVASTIAAAIVTPGWRYLTVTATRSSGSATAVLQAGG